MSLLISIHINKAMCWRFSKTNEDRNMLNKIDEKLNGGKSISGFFFSLLPFKCFLCVEGGRKCELSY
jgi:hypothetical protein